MSLLGCASLIAPPLHVNEYLLRYVFKRGHLRCPQKHHRALHAYLPTLFTPFTMRDLRDEILNLKGIAQALTVQRQAHLPSIVSKEFAFVPSHRRFKSQKWDMQLG